MDSSEEEVKEEPEPEPAIKMVGIPLELFKPDKVKWG